MKKSFLLLVGIFILLVVIAVLVFIMLQSRSISISTQRSLPEYNNVDDSVPDNAIKISEDNAIKISEDYIMSKVGEDYFNENYILERSKKCHNDTHYCIQYEYLPLSFLAGKKMYVTNVVDNEGIDTANEVYDCLQDKKLCEFNITKQDAIDIATKNNFFDNKLFDYKPEEYSIVISPSGPYYGGNAYFVGFWYWDISKSGPFEYDCRYHINIGIHVGTGQATDIGRSRTCS